MGVSGEGASNVGMSTTAIFSVFVGIALETSEISQRYYRGMQFLVGFSVIPKCITLNDHDLLFHFKLWFACQCEIFTLLWASCLK